MKLLVLDDSKAFLAVIKRTLERSGHVCLAATSWPEAIRLTREAPDAVLVDVAMPVIDGFELVKTIRRFWPKLAIILMSGEPGTLYEEQAKNAGADGYIPKTSIPSSLDALLAEVTGSSATKRRARPSTRLERPDDLRAGPEKS